MAATRSRRYIQKWAPRHPRASASGCVYEHILIAETALGRNLPVAAEVHHVDGNGRNNERSNLVICHDGSYHRLLHQRARIVRMGGNPNVERYCGTCRQVKPLKAFNRLRATGHQRICRECAKSRFGEWYRAQRPS